MNVDISNSQRERLEQENERQGRNTPFRQKPKDYNSVRKPFTSISPDKRRQDNNPFERQQTYAFKTPAAKKLGSSPFANKSHTFNTIAVNKFDRNEGILIEEDLCKADGCNNKRKKGFKRSDGSPNVILVSLNKYSTSVIIAV